MNKRWFIKRKTLRHKYINHKLCSTCSDPCCKKQGCDALPLDINPFTVEHIIELIDKGMYSISYVKTVDNEIYPTLRSREVGVGVFNFKLESNPCAFLGENGCTLNEDERPSMALLLVPKTQRYFKDERACIQLLELSKFIGMWAVKADIMDEVVRHYTNGKDFKTLCKEKMI